MTLFVATELVGADDGAPDQKSGPLGVAHALPADASETLCGRHADGLSRESQPWPGGQGNFALCPACESAVRRSDPA